MIVIYVHNYKYTLPFGFRIVLYRQQRDTTVCTQQCISLFAFLGMRYITLLLIDLISLKVGVYTGQ